MNGNFTTEIGRMRMQEAHARAERYRLAQRAPREEVKAKPLTAMHALAYRRALAAVAVSSLIVLSAGALVTTTFLA